MAGVALVTLLFMNNNYKSPAQRRVDRGARQFIYRAFPKEAIMDKLRELNLRPLGKTQARKYEG